MLEVPAEVHLASIAEAAQDRARGHLPAENTDLVAEDEKLDLKPSPGLESRRNQPEKPANQMQYPLEA